MSVFYRIGAILLYVIFGISIVVMAFFYFSEKMIDEAAYNAKKAKIEAPEEHAYRPQSQAAAANTMAADSLVADSLVADSIAAEVADTIAGDSIITAVAPSTPVTPKSADVKPVKFTFFETLVYYKTDIALTWAYILVAITLILALVFPLIFMFSNVKNMIKTLGLLAGVAVMIAIAYLLSSGTPIFIPGFEGTDNSDPGVLKMVDTGIFITYFLLGLALVAILYAEVAKIFK